MQTFSHAMWKAKNWTELFGVYQHFMHMLVIMLRWYLFSNNSSSHHVEMIQNFLCGRLEEFPFTNLITIHASEFPLDRSLVLFNMDDLELWSLYSGMIFAQLCMWLFVISNYCDSSLVDPLLEIQVVLLCFLGIVQQQRNRIMFGSDGFLVQKMVLCW